MFTCVVVAREFGYSYSAISFCLDNDYLKPSQILLAKLWDLDNGGIEITPTVKFPIYASEENAEIREYYERLLLTKYNQHCHLLEGHSVVNKTVNSASYEASIDVLREETQRLVFNKTCVSCLREDRKFLASPCFHFLYCTKCKDKHVTCTFCGSHIDEYIETYLV